MENVYTVMNMKKISLQGVRRWAVMAAGVTGLVFGSAEAEGTKEITSESGLYGGDPRGVQRQLVFPSDDN